MRIFLYEFITGGGWWYVSRKSPPTGSMFDEGRAMIRAIASDFAQLPDTRITVLADSRLDIFDPSLVDVMVVSDVECGRELFCEAARAADYTLIIAPEFDEFLIERVRWAEQSGARLLSPGSELVALASDKQRTADSLRENGIRVPKGVLWNRYADRDWPSAIQFPAVIKRNDGAGSSGVRKMLKASDAANYHSNGQHRIEEYCPGLAASVAVLSGPSGPIVLPPCRQMLSDDGRFQYLGGELPLAPDLSNRAFNLANSVVSALPKAIGYFGIDLVLGEMPDGASDVVIEVNPRLTTSYIGLRELVRTNLAQAMLDVAAGRTIALSFHERSVRFDARGNVTSAGR